MYHAANLRHAEIQVLVQQLILPHPLYMPAGCGVVMDIEAVCPQIQHPLHRAPFQPSSFTPNTASAHTNGLSYYLRVMRWSSNAMQNLKDAFWMLDNCST
jgi:hypothetical protein